MSEIGDDVVVLRHPDAAKARGRVVVGALVLAPIALLLLLMALEFGLDLPVRNGHIPISASLIMFGGFLASALIALPGLMMIKHERSSEELHVGSLGMELRHTQARASGPEVVTSWRIAWSDVARAKLRYRDAARPYYAGVEILTHGGQEQRLYPAEWMPLGQAEGIPPLAGRVLIPDADALSATPLVKALAAKGLQIEDDVPRPQDRLAAWLGLGLGAVAIIAALVFNFIVER